MSSHVLLARNTQEAQGSSTVHSVFSYYAQEQSSSRIVCAGTEISYQELYKRSSELASYLVGREIKVEELVGVLLNRSINAICAQLGILRSGGAYLPLSPDDFPIERIRGIFDDAQVSFVVSESKFRPLIEQLEKSLNRPLRCFYMDDHNHQAANEDLESSLDLVSVKPDNLAYVMYTSGSTGQPKGVMITHENILSTVKDTSYFESSEEDVLLHAAPISFDAATFEIWGALLNGLNLHIAENSLVSDLEALSEYVRTHSVSVMWLTSALFNLLADTQPDTFASLSQLLVGGEALSPYHINKIKRRHPHLRIRNNYGPTENTVFSTSFLIDKEYSLNIPIGRAVCHKRAYVLGADLKKVAKGQEGILYVSGAGVARGYLNRPDETHRKFVPDPYFEGSRMYNTGDLCRYNESGDIEYLGRSDSQVKVLGHRVELGEIETVLLSCPAVHQAVVLHKALGANNEGPMGLATYLKCESSELHDVKQYLSTQLPEYMIPSYWELLDSFPINLNGKLDRATLAEWPIKCAATSSTTAHSLRDTTLVAVKRVLGLEKIDTTKSFFELGGDSISGTRLIVELASALEIELPLTILYGNPVIDDFVSAIEAKRIECQSDAIPVQSSTLSLRKEAELEFDIDINDRSVHQCPDLLTEQGHIFLTGATGFFGAFLLKELLNSTNASISCLVRAKDSYHAVQRISEKFSQYKIPLSESEKARIVGVSGDLSLPLLGLDKASFEELACEVDLIFHNGASVNYVDSYETLRLPNVVGSQEVIRLSCHNRIIPLHYVSSVSVFETLGFFTGRELIYESDTVDETEDYVRLGYSQSKWVAEKMMQNARSQGLPINIYRSGYIMGHSETGVSNTTDHIARYIAGCVEMGAAPILEEYATLAPVDQLSKALCHIAVHSPIKSETMHLCNPDFITVDDIYRKVQDFGFPLEMMSYSEWKERLKEAPVSNPLYPLLSLHIHKAPDHELTLPELYERNTRFDCQRFLTALKGSGIEISLGGSEVFERWLDNYVEEGLISRELYQLAVNGR